MDLQSRVWESIRSCIIALLRSRIFSGHAVYTRFASSVGIRVIVFHNKCDSFNTYLFVFNRTSILCTLAVSHTSLLALLLRPNTILRMLLGSLGCRTQCTCKYITTLSQISHREYQPKLSSRRLEFCAVVFSSSSSRLF